MIAQQYDRAKKVLLDKKDGHKELATILLEKEIIYSGDLENIFGKRPWISRSEEILENKKVNGEEPIDEPKPVGSGDHIFIDTNEKITVETESKEDSADKGEDKKEE